MRAVNVPKYKEHHCNSVMEYIAEYIQNQYHDEFIIRKWIYLSNNYMNEEELPYEDLMIHTILF
jgi:hypothetical protein